MPNELSERPRSALRDLAKEPEQRHRSALRNLRDTIAEQSELKRHAVVLSSILKIQPSILCGNSCAG